MSTFTCSAATASKIAAAEPGRSGTPRRSNRTSSSECVTAETIALLEPFGVLDPGPGSFENVERAWMRTSWFARELDGAQHQHLGPGRRHLEHLLVRDAVELARVRDDPRIGGEDAVDVGVDLAGRAERGGERDRGRVGAAPAERRHVHRVAREALVAGDEDDLAPVERLEHAHGRDLADLRLRVHGVGDDPGLRARERDGLVAEVVHRHRDERAGDPLAGREEHVELARVRLRRDLARELEEPVGRVAHRRDGRDDAHAALARLDEPLRDVLDLVGIGDRRAAELHDDGLGAGRAHVLIARIVRRNPGGRG